VAATLQNFKNLSSANQIFHHRDKLGGAEVYMV